MTPRDQAGGDRAGGDPIPSRWSADAMLDGGLSGRLNARLNTLEGERDERSAQRRTRSARVPDRARAASGRTQGGAEERRPEPASADDWLPPPPLRERLVSAVSTPVVAGGAIVVIAVIIAVVMVALQPHAPSGEASWQETAEEAATQDGSAGLLPGSDSATGSADDGGEQTVYVHVVGEVERPGVVSLSSDARVEDAIDAAGGPTAEAVLSGVNLARVLQDGEQIVVPDSETPSAEAGALSATPGGPGAGAAGGGETVHLNTADAAQLETLPGVGPAIAQRIIEWRDDHGGFSSVDQLLEVSGIGAKTLEGMRDLVRAP